MANDDPWEKLSPKSKRNFKLAALAIIIMLVLALTYVFVVIMPSLQWSYSEELTDIFYEDEFGSDPLIGYEYKVMIDGTTTAGHTKVRLYGRVVYPGADWELKREGYADSDNDLYWQKYY